MTQTTFKFLAAWANPHVVKRIGRARLARWFQRQTRKAWGQRRADAVVAAAEATLALWGPTGLDYDALAADLAVEARLGLALACQIARIDERIFDLYCDADPEQLLLSVPGVGKILAGQIRGRLGDPHRFTSLAAAPRVLRAHSPPELLRAHRHRRRPDQAGRRLPTPGAVSRRRSRPQDRPHPGRPLPAAHVRGRPPPHLRAVHHRHRAAHPDRRLPAQPHALPAARRRRPAHHPSPGTSDHRRALPNPT